jgi:hypothetical protein
MTKIQQYIKLAEKIVVLEDTGLVEGKEYDKVAFEMDDIWWGMNEEEREKINSYYLQEMEEMVLDMFVDEPRR